MTNEVSRIRLLNPARHEAEVRAALCAHGVAIVKERIQPLASGDFIQFHVRLEDGTYWFLDPYVPTDPRNGPGRYQWFRSAASNYNTTNEQL